MKRKIILVALSAVMVVLLCGCGQRNSEQTAPTTTNPAENQAMPGGTTSNEVVTPPAAAPATPPATSQAMTNAPGATNPPAASP